MYKRSNPAWLLVSLAVALVALDVHAAQIEPPKVPVVDRNGVNMANGQVTQSTFTVGIGGAMGLSHSVSVHANEFSGFNGKYNGNGNNVELSTEMYYVPRNVYRIYDFDGTVDFAYTMNGVIQTDGGSYWCGGGFAFKSLGDERDILECDFTYLYWTKPDGTVSRYWRSDYLMNSFAALVDVTYPNGFKVSVQSGMSATTNTGFQVKSIYEPDHRDFRCSVPNPIPGCKNNITTLINTDPNFTNHASGWSTSNPRYIKAINNAVEYCTPTAASCVLTKQWPTAIFNWAAGMPRTLSIGNTTVSIVDMTGKTTWYDFKAYDLAYETLQGGTVALGYTLNREMSPRLIGVRSDGHDRKFTYDYTNVFVTQGEINTWDIRLQTSGKVISANLLGSASTGYAITQPYYNDAVSQAYGIGGIHRVQVKGSAIQGNPGAIYFVESDDGVLERENTVTRNFPVRFSPANGPVQDFEYFRSNLKKIIYRKNQSDSTYVEANFPASCTTTTRKTCNQATSIRDARGNYTYYTYHEPSGGMSTVTYPANKNGLVAQTRFEYQQKQAQYYKGGAGKEAGDPIWMKVSERYCVNSNYSDPTPGDGNPLNGSCAGNDEVITRFEYNHDNLLMTGMTVTSPPPNANTAPPYNTTLRTCFRYDMYGNQIGKTEPNANLTSCP